MKLRRVAAVLLILPLLCCFGCSKEPSESPASEATTPPPTATPTPTPLPQEIVDPAGVTLAERFIPPEGFIRTDIAVGSFAEYLRFAPLREDGTAVKNADGTLAMGVQAEAVLELPLNSDRCKGTDMLLLLRALYLQKQGRYDEIVFHFESGFTYDYESYLSGKRVKVDGSKVSWVSGGAAAEDSPEALTAYLEVLYSYSKATTLKLDTKTAHDLAPGTLFTENSGAFVADMAYNAATGETAVLLLRGCAATAEISCDLFILGDSTSPTSPWVILSDGGGLYVGEVSYIKANLREF